ncbi:2'-5' RNA ligase family protein [Herbiconiux sp. L3-i23]|uniref:2'-5' RNA ligase family protein n=1 Tax=Herbiconiux sp. L3-i23 TaxID=2905871 RepID=UPI00204A7AE1|nr:2'-5' RNA ligase family protein [Herbiconiux sp. L3-i23]BDI23114.1 hypothetical protein L3i23_18900 [Herbiconiux sp. L3-i23]
MPSIELILDDDGDARVREGWRALADAGLPSQADHQGTSNAPHVTAAFTTTPLAPFAVEPPAGPVTLGGVLLFPHRRGVVLGRAVVVTADLLDWHRRLHASLPPDADVDPRTRPDAWTPHVTLARRIPADAVGRAVEVLAHDDLRIRFTSVRLWNGASKTLTPLSPVVESHPVVE